MRAYLRDVGASLAEAFANPYRRFFHWNAGKALCVLHFFVFGTLLALPGLVTMIVSAFTLLARVTMGQVGALADAKSEEAMADAVLAVVHAGGLLPVLGVLAGFGLAAGAFAFAFGYASQVLYQDVLLRAAQGSPLPAVPPLWRSWLALRKYAALISWASLWSALALVPFLVFDALAGRPFFVGALGSVDAYRHFQAMWYGVFLIWAGIRFGFAPLALLSDLRADRTGWSCVAEGWRFSSGRAFWRLVSRWIVFLLTLWLFEKLIMIVLLTFGPWSVPMAALALAVPAALRGAGSSAGRWARAMAYVSLFCLSCLVTVYLYRSYVFYPVEYFSKEFAAAYLPGPVAAVTAFVFLGLGSSFRAVLWRRARAAA